MKEAHPRLTQGWDHSIHVEERLRHDPNFEESDQESPRGWYRNRRIISRDVTIYKGVYLGAGRREAIVVDDEGKYRNEYDQAYSELLGGIYALARNCPELSVQEKVLVPAYHKAIQVLPYDAEGVDALVGLRKLDHKINLGAFMRARAGVCRHQALMVGYFLERLQREGELMPDDEISIDRNTIPGKGGHAWIRYTSSNGTIYIADPAQRRVGTLDSLGDVYWNYRRPGE